MHAFVLAALLALPGFTQIDQGPAGGTVWQGVIGTSARPSVVYLPPRFDPSRRHPVVYLLHGMPGSPSSFVNAMHLAQVADNLIASGRTRPFLAVAPVAGPDARYSGEWTGPWERYVVHEVVPWANAHLPTAASAHERVLAGLSSGAYGAVDIGLRSPTLFGTLEAWGGYFTPFSDGSLAQASPAELAANNPSLLVRREEPALRLLGVRFFLSSGPTHGDVLQSYTSDFARELTSLRLPVALQLFPKDEWWRQLQAGLLYAFGKASGPRSTSSAGSGR
jgi:enterochelin esterase-like enzyme